MTRKVKDRNGRNGHSERSAETVAPAAEPGTVATAQKEPATINHGPTSRTEKNLERGPELEARYTAGNKKLAGTDMHGNNKSQIKVGVNIQIRINISQISGEEGSIRYIASDRLIDMLERHLGRRSIAQLRKTPKELLITVNRTHESYKRTE